MRSFQDISTLQNLYRLKALGYQYLDPLVINEATDQELPNTLESLSTMLQNCHLCDLSKSRTQTMSGFGNPNADIMFVNATVSDVEDSTNSYFEGRSGASLKLMIEKVLNLSVDDIYITHTLKCKPLNTHDASKSEFQSCKPYIQKQIELLQPKVIVALGPDAYYHLSSDDTPFENILGNFINFGSSKLTSIYHPTFLLRNPSLKKVTMSNLINIKNNL